ncbi:MAG: hypothetical protein PPFGHCPK_01099 [Spiroplasma endosymbiont of Drosophila atripex]|nr:MAG: hypothetical protein PPFGHCPK_01099 [Spiroplasma endosymbiont of Drosophila atripex]
MKKIKNHIKVINEYQEFFNQNEEQIQEFTKNWERNKHID